MPKRPRKYPNTKELSSKRKRCETIDTSLLSLEKCRSLLPSDCELTDEELTGLRDSLYCLAGMAMEGALNEGKIGKHLVQ